MIQREPLASVSRVGFWTSSSQSCSQFDMSRTGLSHGRASVDQLRGGRAYVSQHAARVARARLNAFGETGRGAAHAPLSLASQPQGRSTRICIAYYSLSLLQSEPKSEPRTSSRLCRRSACQWKFGLTSPNTQAAYAMRYTSVKSIRLPSPHVTMRSGGES